MFEDSARELMSKLLHVCACKTSTEQTKIKDFLIAGRVGFMLVLCFQSSASLAEEIVMVPRSAFSNIFQAM